MVLQQRSTWLCCGKATFAIACILVSAVAAEPQRPPSREIQPTVSVGVLHATTPNSNATTLGMLKRQGNHATQQQNHGCPAECRRDWLGDGWCDGLCAHPECDNDGGDCNDWCAPDCKGEWIGDGFCDIDCFRSECNYDGGDCKNRYNETDISWPRLAHDAFNYSRCAETCDKALLHNNVCNDGCNTAECNFDGGDCERLCKSTCPRAWLGDGECDYGCRNEDCYFDKGDCNVCHEGCEPGMIGNGVCDMACNTEECHYDMGDCYSLCWSAEKIEYLREPFFYPQCRTEWKGDGFCDCYCMTEECDYDFGDCDNTNCTREYIVLSQMYGRLGIPLENFPFSLPRKPALT